MKLIEFLEVSGGWIWIGFVGFVGMSHFFPVFNGFQLFRQAAIEECLCLLRPERPSLTSACRASRSSVLRILAADGSMMYHDVPLGIVSRVGRTDFMTSLDVDALND